MTQSHRNIMMFAGMAALLALVGVGQGWDVALLLLNMCIISAIMALGVNIQWGYAGLFSIGSMGFAALGGLAGVIVSASRSPAPAGRCLGAWRTSCHDPYCGAGVFVWRRLANQGRRQYLLTGIVVPWVPGRRGLMGPAIAAIEEVDPAAAGYLGGMGLPIILSWAVGGRWPLAPWVVGKVSLGLRSDYLAIATLGISEIIIFVLKFEDWLTRGVKNVTGLPRPVPYEVDLIASSAFQDWATSIGSNATAAASIVVKLCYAGLFSAVLLLVLYLSEIALRSPWGTDDARYSRQRDRCRGNGQECEGAPPAGVCPGVGCDRHCRCDAYNARRAVHPDKLSAAPLHLPDLGDGDNWRVRQQLGRGSWRLCGLVLLDRGRADGAVGHKSYYLRHVRGQRPAPAPSG